jgi:hypothetical protein
MIRGRDPSWGTFLADAVVKSLEQLTLEVEPFRLSRALAVLNPIVPRTTDRIVRRNRRKRP